MLVDIGLKCQTKSQLTFETYTGNIPVTLINQGHPKIFIDKIRPFSLAELEVRGMDSSISINKFYLFTKNGYILLEPLWPKWKGLIVVLNPPFLVSCSWGFYATFQKINSMF